MLPRSLRFVVAFSLLGAFAFNFNDIALEIKSKSKLYQKQASGSLPQNVEPISYMVPMRDGVKLYTNIWIPPIYDEFQTRLPAVMDRSPYGPDATQNFADLYLPWGFVAVMQNQRGTGNSEGNFTFWNNAWTDGYDTMEWVSQQPWSNGKVFQMGASADGILSYLDMLHPQPRLHGQWLIFATSYPYDITFLDGTAYRESLVHNWLHIMQKFRPDAPSYEKFVLKEEGYSEFWANRTLTNLTTVNFPAIHLAGWYDIFLQPMLDSYMDYQTLSSPNARGHQHLIVEPRGHCLSEDFIDFEWDTLGYVWAYERSVAIFLDQDDRDFPEIPQEFTGKLDTVTLYVMGPSYWIGSSHGKRETTGMYWTTGPDFPTPTNMTFYLTGSNSLDSTPPASSLQMTYVYNPANPVPTIGGNNLFIPCGPLDQTPVESRNDVVLFTTPVLTQNIAVCGRIVVKLSVASNCTDTDFTVKITDVYPQSYNVSVLVSGDVDLRMRWRDGDVKPKLMVPGQVYDVEIPMWHTCYIFNAGHRIRLAVSSSNFPRFSVNPNNGLMVDQDGPLNVAANSIFVGGNDPSALILPTVTMDQIPSNVLW